MRYFRNIKAWATGTAYLFVIGADGTASAGIEVDVT